MKSEVLGDFVFYLWRSLQTVGAFNYALATSSSHHALAHISRLFMMTPNSKPEWAQGFPRSRAEKKHTHTSYLGDVCCVSIGNDNMTCSGVAVPYHTLHNTPHSPLLPTTTPHTANHTPHTDHLKPLSSRNIPLNPSPSASDRTP